MTNGDLPITQETGEQRADMHNDLKYQVVVMGVCASGKTTFGQALAERLGGIFIDGDDLHPEQNVRKMAAGTPLNDADRQPWLESIRDLLGEFAAREQTVIIACSALKKAYRDLLREGAPEMQFVFLDLSKSLILKRIRLRTEHFMKADMVDSQFATLERPEHEANITSLYKEKPIADMVNDCLAAWRDK